MPGMLAGREAAVRKTFLAVAVSLIMVYCQPAQAATQACSTAAHNAGVLYSLWVGSENTEEDVRRLHYSIVSSGLPTSQIVALVRGLAYLARRAELGEPIVPQEHFVHAVYKTCEAVEIQDGTAI